MKHRKTAPLSESLDRRLHWYAVAAMSSGIGLAALAQPAAAEIVYTPANTPIPQPPGYFEPGLIHIDLNHDGAVDFTLINTLRGGSCSPGLCSVYGSLFINPQSYNSIAVSNRGYAADLPVGVEVAPKNRLNRGPKIMIRGYCRLNNQTSYVAGPWIDVQNRYLGVKFAINGENHYGWIRLTVESKPFCGVAERTLTGYAYETVANKPITTGTTPVATPSSDIGSLGQLARGATAK